MNASEEYKKWSNEALKQLPELSERTFALRDGKDSLKGFNYLLESQLGKIINFLNNPSEYPEDMACELVHKVAFEQFVKTLETEEEFFIFGFDK